MARPNKIPTARYRGGRSDRYRRHALWAESIGFFPLVLKGRRLAAGKGVVIVDDLAQARSALYRHAFRRMAFGQASRRVVVEEFLVGEEASFIVIADGESILRLASSQDQTSAANDGDMVPTPRDGRLFPRLRWSTSPSINRSWTHHSSTLDGMRSDVPFRLPDFSTTRRDADPEGPRVPNSMYASATPETRACPDDD